MIGTDKYAYVSKLKNVNPLAKLCVSFISVAVCLLANSFAVSVFTIILMCAVTTRKGGSQLCDFLRLLLPPFLFILIGCATILVGKFPQGTELLIGFSFGQSLYGITLESLLSGFRLILKALGVIASVYFFVMNTPVTDLSWAMQKLHAPQLFIELMELIYRFIFILTETMHRIHTAQASRLGYNGLKNAYYSTGTLASMVFLRAYKKSDRIYSALESRGYTGSLTTLAMHYESGKRMYMLCVIATAVQISLFFMERAVLL